MSGMRQKVSRKGGPPPPPQPSGAKRNREIARAKAQGKSWASIARQFGVSVRTAQRAVEEHLGVGDRYSDDTEPMLMLAEVIAVHVDALDRLAALAETADSTSAAVGAIRSRVATANDLLGLLGLIGVTPATQNEWMYHQEVQTVIGALMNVAREHGVADEVLARLRENPPFSTFARALERNRNGGRSTHASP